jgi:hypothetical protein
MGKQDRIFAIEIEHQITKKLTINHSEHQVNSFIIFLK